MCVCGQFSLVRNIPSTICWSVWKAKQQLWCNFHCNKFHVSCYARTMDAQFMSGLVRGSCSQWLACQSVPPLFPLFFLQNNLKVFVTTVQKMCQRKQLRFWQKKFSNKLNAVQRLPIIYYSGDFVHRSSTAVPFSEKVMLVAEKKNSVWQNPAGSPCFSPPWLKNIPLSTTFQISDLDLPSPLIGMWERRFRQWMIMLWSRMSVRCW